VGRNAAFYRRNFAAKNMKSEIRYVITLLCIALSLWGCEKELKLNDPGALVPKTVDQDLSLPTITVNGTRLHSEAFGDPADPIVIFLHGGPGGDYRNGLNVKNLVTEHYYVVFYDQRGSGLSQRHPKNSHSIQLMLDDLTAVINHYRTSPAQKVFLFGHSWGAMLATAYINTYPAAINGVILAEPGGFTWSEVKEYAKKSRKINLFNETTSDVLYPDQFLSGKPDDHAVMDYKLALASAFTYAKNNKEGIEGPSPFWRNGAAVAAKFFEIGKDEGFNFRNNLNQFHTKVLFLYSQNNTAYGKAFAQQLATAFTNRQLEQVSGTGHEMIYFQWNAVHAVVVPYLNELR
jgi:proline iminopeptidase